MAHGTPNPTVTISVVSDNFTITLGTTCDKPSYSMFNDYSVIMTFSDAQHAVIKMCIPHKF